jgi:hypothetical protein
MTTTNGLQLPRPNTGARAVIDQLATRALTYTDAVDIYMMARRNISGTYPSKRHVGYTITRLLKRYGYKTGKSGSKAPWAFRPQTVSMPANPPRQDDVDETDRFSLPDDPPSDFPIDCLVKYNGPVEQDRGTIGRVIGWYEGAPSLRAVTWCNTEESERVDVKDLVLHKPSISKPATGSDDVGGAYTRTVTPGFEIGDQVLYAGDEYGTRGKRGKVVGIYRNRRQVQWEGNLGQSSEDLSDLKAFTPPPPAVETLKVGQFVECRKNGLTFPGKVILGPLSSGMYKVVAPNGTFEWLGRDQMTPKEEKDVYQATPEKPQYEGEPEESAQTKHLKQQLADSQRRDKLVHWARLGVRGLTLEQKTVLLEVLEDEIHSDD